MTLQEKKDKLYNLVDTINSECPSIPTIEAKEKGTNVIKVNIKWVNRAKEVYKRLLYFCADNDIIILTSSLSYLDCTCVDYVELYLIDED